MLIMSSKFWHLCMLGTVLGNGEWTHHSGINLGLPNNIPRCSIRHKSAESAKAACTKECAWCVGFVRDGGMPCAGGHNRFELRSGPLIPAANPNIEVWLLHRVSLETACDRSRRARAAQLRAEASARNASFCTKMARDSLAMRNLDAVADAVDGSMDSLVRHAQGCLQLTTPALSLATYPEDAEAHYLALHAALAPVAGDIRAHEGSHYAGPWIENYWIDHFRPKARRAAAAASSGGKERE